MVTAVHVSICTLLSATYLLAFICNLNCYHFSSLLQIACSQNAIFQFFACRDFLIFDFLRFLDIQIQVTSLLRREYLFSYKRSLSTQFQRLPHLYRLKTV
ncbi:hypothetical protein BDP27DRAFT_318670 [Rhodocollybia butyracea]|uniref:Uncharacterized protein n=1 Tax=Rhodocollybia butyracea TaxID=206335 RepID=A0A9P5Q201_9AGAR|nr:hypothetical protein BDP27DRAFT_318670 [Rhodocollybia butyracea]